MKIGVLTVAFNESEFIEPCIKQFDGFNFFHMVLVSGKPWRGEYTMDDTWAKAKMYINNGDVLIGQWEDQASQFNQGLTFLSEICDWALIVDADEFYTAEDIGRLVGAIRTTEYDAILANNMDVYWKTPDYKVWPEQYDYPVIAIKTSKKFKNKRSVESDVITTNINSVTLHHMSYVRNDADMLKKINSFEHSHEFDQEHWYHNVWLPWEVGSTMLHPTVPSKFAGVQYDPAPLEIRELLKWDS